MTFAPCLGVKDTAASIAFYKGLGFEVDSRSAERGDDIHMLLYKNEFCAMLYSRAELAAWLPALGETNVGFSGMFYLGVDDFLAVHERISGRARIVKDVLTDSNGVREFYFRDPDGYVIGVNDRSSLAASDTVGDYS